MMDTKPHLTQQSTGTLGYQSQFQQQPAPETAYSQGLVNAYDGRSPTSGGPSPYSPLDPFSQNLAIVPEITSAPVVLSNAAPVQHSDGSITGDHRSNAGYIPARSVDGSDIMSPLSAQAMQGNDGVAYRPTSGTSIQDDDQMENHDPDATKDDDNAEKPAWSELKTKAGKERKRLPLACIACRRKKIRCSGEKPACKHCVRSRIPCVYKVTTRKAAPRTDYMAMLDKRLKRMEERVIKYVPKQDLADMSNVTRASVKPALPGQPSKSKAAPTKKRSAEEDFTAEMNKWTKTTSAQDSEIPRLPRQQIASRESKLLTEGAEHLPSMELQEHLAEVFFDCIYGQAYLLLHKPSFMRRLKAKTVPPVLILAICAIAARFSTHPKLNTSPAFQRGREWAEPAEKIVLSRHDEPNITILIVLLILGLHEFGTCHGGKSWSFGGMALRMAYALQLHRELDYDPLGRQGEQSSELSFTDREIRRRTMWACFMMDRFNSSGSDRPPFGNEEFMNVQLPIKETNFEMEIPGPTEDLDGNTHNPIPAGTGQVSNPKENMGVAAYIIRAIVLWGRITNYLNLGGMKKDPHPFWSPESKHRQLKQQVEEFRASLPKSLVFSSENLQNHAADRIANQFLFLHIVNHQNMLFLHRFAIPTAPGATPPKEIPTAFLRESARIAVDSATEISRLVQQGSSHIFTVPFAGYCVYVSSTVHIWGNFSKNAELEARSKENLRHNYKYLNIMKKYWGMFHYMALSVRDLYRTFADATLQGKVPSAEETASSPVLQYGDWFDKYPHGVPKSDFDDGETSVKKDASNEAVMGQRSMLQSVEEFFRELPTTPENPRKQGKANRKGAASTAAARITAKAGDSSKTQQKPQPQPQPPPPRRVMNQLAPSTPLAQDIGNNPPRKIETPARSMPQQNPAGVPMQGLAGLPGNNQHMMQQQLQSNFYANPVGHMDRQFVFGAYAGMENHNESHQGSDLATNALSSNPNLWDSMDINGMGAGFGSGFGDASDFTGGMQPDNVSSWFTPFNLEPPIVHAHHQAMAAYPQDSSMHLNGNVQNSGMGGQEPMSAHSNHGPFDDDAAMIFASAPDATLWGPNGFANGLFDGQIPSGRLTQGQGSVDGMDV